MEQAASVESLDLLLCLVKLRCLKVTSGVDAWCLFQAMHSSVTSYQLGLMYPMGLGWGIGEPRGG